MILGSLLNHSCGRVGNMRRGTKRRLVQVTLTTGLRLDESSARVVRQRRILTTDIGNDAWCLIFSFLYACDHVKLASTCRTLADVGGSPASWRLWVAEKAPSLTTRGRATLWKHLKSESLYQLKTFCFKGKVEPPLWKCLGNFRKLHVLEIYHTGYSRAKIRPYSICNLAHLRKLVFHNLYVRELHPCIVPPSVQRFHFINCFTEAVTSSVPRPSLRCVDLSQSEVHSFWTRRTVPNLEEFRARQSTLSSLSEFRNHPTLRCVDIAASDVKSVEDLADCPKLERLAVNGAPIRNLFPLENNESLRTVAINVYQLIHLPFLHRGKRTWRHLVV